MSRVIVDGVSRVIADTLAGLVGLVGVDRTRVDEFAGVVEHEDVEIVLVNRDVFAGVALSDVDSPGVEFE